MTYQTRTPQRPEASGGQLSNPLPGLGKLSIGRHKVCVLALTPGPNDTTIIVETLAREAHAESVAWVPPWVTVGLPVDVQIRFTAGAIVCRNVKQYQGQDADTLTPLTDWLDSVEAVYAALPAGLKPATTRLESIAHANFGLHRFSRPEYPAVAATGESTPTDPGSDRPVNDPS